LKEILIFTDNLPMTSNNKTLPIGSRVDQYRILKVLGVGGFSVVYLAAELESDCSVVIKEYMPKRLATREENGNVAPKGEGDTSLFHQGRSLFLHEARTLANIKHKNIVDVSNFFSANDTVYMVMSYVEGVNLQAYIRDHKGGLSEKFIRTIFSRLLEGLKHIHSMGILHLDIKPGNIHIRPGGVPILLDFGAVHQQRLSRQNKPSQVISPGYSPYEQCQPGGYMGPWSDLYAIGTTMRACIEGAAPISANDRMLQDRLKPMSSYGRKGYSKSLLAAIDWAMEPDPLLRPQSVDEFLSAMNEGYEEAGHGEASQDAFMDWVSSNLLKIRTVLDNFKKD